MYPPVNKYRIVFDKNTSLYKDVLITSWKEKDKVVANKEMFNAYYMFNMYLISYEGDRVVQVAIDGKYAVKKALDFLLREKENQEQALVVNNTVYCSEIELSTIKKQNEHCVFVFDPLEEERKRWEY